MSENESTLFGVGHAAEEHVDGSEKSSSAVANVTAQGGGEVSDYDSVDLPVFVLDADASTRAEQTSEEQDKSDPRPPRRFAQLVSCFRAHLKGRRDRRVTRAIELHGIWLKSSAKNGWRARLKGCDLSNRDLSKRSLRKADLRQVDLNGANLRDADLSGADLRQADLREANVYRCNLKEANLCRADLSGLGLKDTNLDRANLEEALLRGCDLLARQLEGCKYLRNAQFDNAFIDHGQHAESAPRILVDVDLRGCNLSGARILEAEIAPLSLGGVRSAHARPLEEGRVRGQLRERAGGR